MKQWKFLTGLAVVLLSVQACGSDDGKKKAAAQGDAGMGGEAGTGLPPSGGGSASGAPTNPAGAGGMEPEVPVGGMGGSAGTGEPPTNAGMGGVPVVVVPGGAGAGGAAGEPNLPEPELLFSVKSGAHGLDGSAVSLTTNPQNAIYTSSTGSQRQTDGTNTVKITGAELGLDPTDQIVAFSLLQKKPQNPLYLFTLGDGSEGSYEGRAERAHDEADDEEAHLYYSDGQQSYRDQNEGGDSQGYNALLASDVSLGLTPGEVEQYGADDLTGLAVHDARSPITELYFTVSRDAVGAAGTAVAGATGLERGCTVFKSALDGTNSVAFTCTQLGLYIGGEAIGDQIDGLAVFGEASPSEVMFSLDYGSSGAEGSAVEATIYYERPATLFTSPGDGSNEVAKSSADFGLGESGVDEIDGFTVVEAPVSSVAKAHTCQLTYDPTDSDTGGALTQRGGFSYIGESTLVMFGQTSEAVPRLIAYDATTCGFLKQKDMPLGFDNANALAIVPLTGWTASDPFKKVEYLRVTVDGDSSLAISRYDAEGAFVAAFPIAGTSYNESVASLVYEPLHDRLFMVLERYNYLPSSVLAVMQRPSAAVTEDLQPDFFRLTTPCAYNSRITGTDALGNLIVAKPQSDDTQFRVCTYTPFGEIQPQPQWWTADTGSDREGFISPTGQYFLLRTDSTPFEIERGAVQAP